RRGPACRTAGARPAVHELGRAAVAAPGAGRQFAVRGGRYVLRVSDQAARVPDALSRLLPPRRRHAGGSDSARGAAHPAAIVRLYRRLFAFLRPHRWRMAGNIAFNFIGAALDGYSFALLIPFLNAAPMKLKAMFPA